MYYIAHKIFTFISEMIFVAAQKLSGTVRT